MRGYSTHMNGLFVASHHLQRAKLLARPLRHNDSLASDHLLMVADFRAPLR
jgi:hypothetical protein